MRELTGPIRTLKGAALGLKGAKVDGVALGLSALMVVCLRLDGFGCLIGNAH